MLNKNYVIIGGVIVAIIGGAIFWSRNSSSTPDASSLEHGTKNLTRNSAAEMIKTFFQVQPQAGLYLGKTLSANYDEKTGSYTLSGSYDIKLPDLEKEGFIKLLPKENNWDFQQKVSLTEKTKPYLKTIEVGGVNAKYIILADVVSVEVTGITEATESGGKTTRIADFTAKFKPTPIGVAIDKKVAEDIKSKAHFILYDDGWRIDPTLVGLGI